MNKEERQQKEGALEQLRTSADAAHQAAAAAPGDEALAGAAEIAEDAYNDAKAELDAAPPASDEEEEEDEKDIDFEKELKDLEGTPPVAPSRYTELEKAERTLFFNAKRLRVLQPKDPATPPARAARDEEVDNRYVTKDDLAEQEAEKLSTTEAQRKVIMHHYQNSIVKSGNIKADIENAFYIANKGRIRRSIDEIRRAQDVRPTAASGPGRRPAATPRVPQLSSGDQATLRRRGFKPNADGSWEAKRYVMKFSPGKGWVTEKKQ